MRIEHEIDGPILVIHQNGVTDPDEIIRGMNTAFLDPRLEPESHLLWNAVDAPAQATSEKMRMLLHDVRLKSDKLSSRCAMVVASEHQYGVSRMFSAYAEGVGVDVEVFYDFDEAKVWLKSDQIE